MGIDLKSFLRGPAMLTFGAGLLTATLMLAPDSGLASPSDDAFLKMLEGEAQKIGGEAPADKEDGDQGNDNKDANGDGSGEFPKGLSQEEFGDLLKKSYPGSYVVYIKLMANVRAEIYRDYKDGAGIEEIRAKISERTMHR